MRPLEPVPAIVESQYQAFIALDQRVDEAEGEGLRARWEFGQALLRQRRGKQLPPGLLDLLAEKTGKSRTELKYRVQFADMYPEVANALATFDSWSSFVTRPKDREGRQLPPAPLLPVGAFSVLYADPPWRYEQASTPSRAVENQYPTMELEDIMALDVPAADDCVLFLWATSPKLSEAMQVVDAWGFQYRTNMVWVKDRIGMGYYVRSQHELLLIAKRGAMPLPSEGTLPPSVVTAPRRAHSQKPDEVYAIIDALYPGYPKVELFARRNQEGWQSWGNEVAA